MIKAIQKIYNAEREKHLCKDNELFLKGVPLLG